MPDFGGPVKGGANLLGATRLVASEHPNKRSTVQNPLVKPAGDPFEVTCPCCGALLKIDPDLRKVTSHHAPRRHARSADIDHAAAVLQKDAQRREALFRHSEEEEKVKSQLLDRKFAEALEKTRGEPVTRPAREIDLD